MRTLLILVAVFMVAFTAHRASASDILDELREGQHFDRDQIFQSGPDVLAEALAGNPDSTYILALYFENGERGFDAVIWTALTPGFQGKRGAPPKLEEALAHLRGLEGESRKNAEEYIRRAPAQIKTLYRAAIEDEFKWTPV